MCAYTCYRLSITEEGTEEREKKRGDGGGGGGEDGPFADDALSRYRVSRQPSASWIISARNQPWVGLAFPAAAAGESLASEAPLAPLRPIKHRRRRGVAPPRARARARRTRRLCSRGRGETEGEKRKRKRKRKEQTILALSLPTFRRRPSISLPGSLVRPGLGNVLSRSCVIWQLLLRPRRYSAHGNVGRLTFHEEDTRPWTRALAIANANENGARREDVNVNTYAHAFLHNARA